MFQVNNIFLLLTLNIFHTLFQCFYVIIECVNIKKVRSSQPAILVLNWIKHYSFSVWLSLTIKPFDPLNIIKGLVTHNDILTNIQN